MHDTHLQGAIFDLDGTLLDSMWVWAAVDRSFLGARGFDVPEDYVEAIAHLGLTAAAEYTIARFELNETVAEISAEWDRLARTAYEEQVMLKPFAKEYLLSLKARGIRLAAATASPDALYIPALKHNGIYDLFDAFTTVEEVNMPKGHPAIYLKAAQKLGLLPQNCVVFEDILPGIAGAKQGGFYAVGVFDPSAAAQKREICSLCDRYIYSFEELL